MLDIFLAYTMREAKQLQATLTACLTMFSHLSHDKNMRRHCSPASAQQIYLYILACKLEALWSIFLTWISSKK